jgi:hypothetical protein
MFFIIDFEDYSAISIDFLLTFLMFLLTLKTIPMFLLTFLMFLLTLKTIPLFLIDLKVYSDVSIDFCDVSINFLYTFLCIGIALGQEDTVFSQLFCLMCESTSMLIPTFSATV